MTQIDLSANPGRNVQRVRYQPGSRLLTVLRIEPLSPTMVRIVLGGDDLERDFPIRQLATADHVKIVFPDPSTGTVILPEPGQLRIPRPNGEQWITRDYTIRAFDHDRRELSIDFVLHGHGPAGRWAQGARSGSRLGVLGPRGSQVYSTQYSHYLLVADETGLPALERFAEELPHSLRISALIEVNTAADERIFKRSGLEVEWMHRDEGESAHALESFVREIVQKAGTDIFVWAAGEAGSVRPLRRLLLDELGFNRDQVDLHGYWRVGTAGSIGDDALDD
jgi:NADPH-dependent ferric siderophore reductase